MSETKKFCTKCGTARKNEAKFCSACGEPFPSAHPAAAGTLDRASEIAGKVSSTVSSVESTISSAQNIAQAAGQLSPIVIRPPGQWKVVVGELLPVAGQKMVDSAVSTARQQVEQKVREEVSQQITEKFRTPAQPARGGPTTPPESFVPQHMVPHVTSGGTCPSCGTQFKPGARFCRNCGARFDGGASAPPASPPSPTCPRCRTVIVPGKKFCGNCGQKLE